MNLPRVLILTSNASGAPNFSNYTQPKEVGHLDDTLAEPLSVLPSLKLHDLLAYPGVGISEDGRLAMLERHGPTLEIHLAAPCLRMAGNPTCLPASWWLFEREYYQTQFDEKYLLLTPFIVHVVSGIARRLAAPAPKQSVRKLTSRLSPSAYAAVAVFVPTYIFTYRLAPADASAPIFAVGPAELDYKFVKTALHRFPWRSWVLYLGLVVSVLVYTVEGVNVLRITWLGAARLTSKVRKLITGAVVLPVTLGPWKLSLSPLIALSSTVERYSACLTRLWVYRV